LIFKNNSNPQDLNLASLIQFFATIASKNWGIDEPQTKKNPCVRFASKTGESTGVIFSFALEYKNGNKALHELNLSNSTFIASIGSSAELITSTELKITSLFFDNDAQKLELEITDLVITWHFTMQLRFEELESVLVLYFLSNPSAYSGEVVSLYLSCL
jgi:hypothetical protein